MAVAKELRKLTADPPEGIKVLLNEDDVTDITADISGPGAAAAGRSARAAAPNLRVPAPARDRLRLTPPHLLHPRRRDAGPGRQLQGAAGAAVGLSERATQRRRRPPARASHSRTPPARPRLRATALADLSAPAALPGVGAHTVTSAGAAVAGYFLTKIFHPNIAKSGEICVNTLKRDWKADLGIGHVLQARRCDLS